MLDKLVARTLFCWTRKFHDKKSLFSCLLFLVRESCASLFQARWKNGKNNDWIDGLPWHKHPILIQKVRNIRGNKEFPWYCTDSDCKNTCKHIILRQILFLKLSLKICRYVRIVPLVDGFLFPLTTCLFDYVLILPGCYLVGIIRSYH